MPRHPLLTATLVILAATSMARGQDEPERIRRFDGPEVTVSSSPVAIGRTQSTLLVRDGYAHSARIWRLSDSGTAPEVILSAPWHDAALWDWAGASRAVGETLLVARNGGVWRVDAEGAPQMIEESGATIGSALGVAFLAKGDAERGVELWSTDGTVGGASLVRDIEPGATSSEPRDGMAVGSTLFFTAFTSPHGRELWRTDGTPEGTALVVDLVPGPESGDPTILGTVDGAVLVRGTDAQGAEVLWRTDGTASGTVAIYRDDSEFPSYLTGMAFGEQVLFLAGDSLWRTDGTESGTVELVASGVFELLDEARGVAYFIAREVPYVTQLWCTDGTIAGTHVVFDRGEPNAGVRAGRAFQGDLVFSAVSIDEGTGLLRTDLWRTNGTAEGTHVIVSQDDGVRIRVPSYMPNDYYRGLIEPIGDAIYFAGTGAGGVELWVSDGTPGGVRAVDLAADRRDAIHEMATCDGSLFLAASENESGRELWVSDGTADGTAVLTELADGAESSWVAELTDVGEELIFAGGGSDPTLYGLYRATTESHAFISRVHDGETDLWALRLHRIGDHVYFRGDSGLESSAWRTDGTADGTIELGGSEPYRFYDVGGTVAFFSRRGGNWDDLWTSDGTESGTTRIQALTPPIGQTYATPGVVLDGVLYFGAAGSDDGHELWRSDGTAAGTYVDVDLVAGEGSATPDHLFPVGDRLFFSARGADGDQALYVRESAGSVNLAWDGGGHWSPDAEGVMAIGDELLFLANDAEHGRELWITDDSSAGARMLRDIDVGAGWFPPRDFIDVGGGRVVFVAYDARHGTELWMTDGTSPGTLLVADLVPGPDGSHPSNLTLMGEALLLSADGFGHASDLWRIPLAFLDGVAEPAPLPAFEALPPLAPGGSEPAPIELPPTEPDPEPLTLDVLRVRLDSKRTERDTLRAKFKLPIDCLIEWEGLPLRIDVGGVIVDVTLDWRGRAKPAAGVRVCVREVRPRRKKEERTEVRVDVEIRRADLRAPLEDENFILQDGERRVDREIRVLAEWCGVVYATTATVRYKRRRGVGRVNLVDDD